MLKIFILCKKFRTIHIFWYFLLKCPLGRWFDPGWPQNHVFAHIFFFKLAKWKIFRRSWKSGKFSDLSVHLLQSVWKLAHFRVRIIKILQFSKKLEKWKIFRFPGKFSSTANIPIHQILEEKSPFFPNWKIFHLLHLDWNFAH